MMIFRLLVAVFCGAVIGFERSRRQKEAGIRTHIMVTLGSALVVIVSKYGYLDVVGTPGVNVDVSRMAANIITGVSFLGAGVIFLRGLYVKGLTTAAGIWTAAGIGCAIGVGMYTVGLFTTFLIVVIQTILHITTANAENTPMAELDLKIVYRRGAISDIRNIFKKTGIKIIQTSIEKNTDDTLDISMSVRISKNVSADMLFDIFDENADILEFSVQL